jgi:hypothetical protein
MPTKSEHEVKAKNNRDFLATIDRQQFPTWAATVAFYAAMHLVEAIRASSQHGHSASHNDRLMYVQASHPMIHSDYQALLNVSMLARYLSQSDFFNQFQPDDIDQVVIVWLDQIETYARSLGIKA